MKVRVYTDYSPVKILRGVDGKEFTEPTDALAEKLGLVGAFVEVEHDSLPEERTDRNLWKVVDGAVVVCEPTQEYLVGKFNPDIAIGREAQVFTGEELIRLMPFSYTLNELIRFKNFWGGVANEVPYAGLQQVLAGLVSGSMITQSDSDKLAGILAEQGIILA